jgi:dipeptidyl-peptidase-4
MTSRTPSRFRMLAAALLATVAPLAAQDSRPAAAESRPLTVEEVLTEGAKFRPATPSQWMFSPDGRACFVRSSPEGEALVAVEKEPGRTTVLLSAAAVAEAAGKLGFTSASRRLPPLEFADGGRSVVFTAAAKDGGSAARLKYVLDAGTAAVLVAFPADAEAVIFPRENVAAYVRARDVYVAFPSGETRRLTEGGGPDLKHGLSAHREEFGIRDGLWADPTGRRIAWYVEDLSPITPYPFADYRATPAERVHGRYPTAGRRHSIVRIGVHDLAAARTVSLDTRPELDRWLTNVTFSPDGETIYVAVVARSQDRCDLRAYDAATGADRGVLFSESDPEWVEPEHGPLFPPGRPTEFLWLSPRDGFRHFHLYDVRGNPVRAVTRGPRDVAEVVGFAPDGSAVYYLASDDDPKTMHLWRAPTAAAAPERLTEGRGRRRVKLAPDANSALLLREDAETPPVLELLDLRSGKTTVLAEAPSPFAGRAVPEERFFTVESPHGGLLHGHVMLPPHRAPGEKFPLLWYVYGGPHSQLVVDAYGAGADLWLRAMACSGYVVARVDGHGTDNRGIEWSQKIHRRLGTVEIADQLAALAYVKGLPEVDPTRAGCFGWSFGGFMTASLLCRAPEAFRAGAAGAPVVDWALYETGYGERYMDAPAENPRGYAEADVATHVGKLKGRLLLIHGTSDDTVVPQHTMKLVDQAIAKGVEIEYFPYPGHVHAVQGRARQHLYRKLTAFFAAELRPTR